METTPDKATLWNQYSLYVDLYKFYMDLFVKINLFYYGIRGAILSFYFAHPNTPHVALALGLPIAMSVVLAGIFFYGASLMPILRRDLFVLRDKLGLSAAPDLGILTIVLRAFGSLLLVVAGVLIFSLVCANKPSRSPGPTPASVTSAAGQPPRQP
jgi:hypothetical protein